MILVINLDGIFIKVRGSVVKMKTEVGFFLDLGALFEALDLPKAP